MRFCDIALHKLFRGISEILSNSILNSKMRIWSSKELLWNSLKKQSPSPPTSSSLKPSPLYLCVNTRYSEGPGFSSISPDNKSSLLATQKYLHCLRCLEFDVTCKLFSVQSLSEVLSDYILWFFRPLQKKNELKKESRLHCYITYHIYFYNNEAAMLLNLDDRGVKFWSANIILFLLVLFFHGLTKFPLGTL